MRKFQSLFLFNSGIRKSWGAFFRCRGECSYYEVLGTNGYILVVYTIYM
jgi:hypothetical protein